MKKTLITLLISCLMLPMVGSYAAKSTKSQRDTISLDGTWEIGEGSWDTMPTTFPSTVPVPGMIDMATPAFETPGSCVTLDDRNSPWLRMTDKLADPLREAFWYRRTFTVNRSFTKVALLKVHKARFGATVYLNGKEVGENEKNFTPGWFDLKPYIKTDGSENELVIRVGASLKQVKAHVTEGWDNEKSRYIPGIYDSVELILSGTPHITNVQVAPNLEKSTVRLLVELANHTKKPVKPTVTAIIKEAKSGKVVAEQELMSDEIGAMRGFMIDDSVELDKPHYWTPEDPFLYTLTVNTGTDTYTTRFGMRSFRVSPKTRQVLLNEKPYYLRGSNVCIFRFFEDEMRKGNPWDREWVRQLHRKFKDMNWNSLRYCVGFPPEFWYDIADEEGILIQDEYPIWYRPRPKDGFSGWHPTITLNHLVDEYTDWMRERWNHPCVVIWDAQNETRDDAITAQAIQKVRFLDLSNRPWENGWGSPMAATDVAEAHPYYFGRLNPDDMLSKFKDNDGDPFRHRMADHSVKIINEYGWLWLNRDGSLPTLTEEVYHNILGEDATVEERRIYYARTLAAMTGFWRYTRKSAGVVHFCGLGYSRPDGQTSDNFVDIQNLEFEKHFYHYVRDSFAPIAPVIAVWETQFVADTAVTVPVKIINDTNDKWSGAVNLRLIKDGEILWTGKEKAKVEALGVGTAEFEITFPQAWHLSELIAEIKGVDGETVISSRIMKVRSE